MGDVPIFVASVEIDSVESFGVVAPGRFEGGGEAAFLLVPAVESFDVAGGVIQVVEGGVDGEVGEAAEGLEPGGDVCGGEARAGDGVEGEVEVAVGAGLEVEAVAEEDAKSVGAGASGLELGEGPLGVGREGEGVIEEGGAEAGSGGEGEVVDDGFAGAIPVFDGGVEIAVEEVDGGEKVVAVVVAGDRGGGRGEDGVWRRGSLCAGRRRRRVPGGSEYRMGRRVGRPGRRRELHRNGEGRRGPCRGNSRRRGIDCRWRECGGEFRPTGAGRKAVLGQW